MTSKIFSIEPLNKGRQNEFDWAKSFAILVMIVVHVYEMMGSIDPETTPERYAALMRAVAERNRRVVEKLRNLG